MHIEYQDVLDYWFAGTYLGSEQRSRWWQKKAATDNEIQQRFGSLIATVADSLHKEWAKTAQGRLAAIICFDQFPRSIYRHSGRAFSFDEKALFLTVEGLNCGHDIKLDVLEKTFFMMPLMHDESLDSQDRCVEFYESVIASTTDDLNKYLRSAYDFALRHREIIEKFGRYPHRNHVLGRHGTPEEELFLSQLDSSF